MTEPRHEIDNQVRLDLLREALPYIQRFQGQTFVVKLSGKVTENAENLASLAEELALLHQVGIRICVVHGGGKQLTELASKLGIEQTIIEGRRVTDDATLEMAKMIFAGKINTDILAALRQRGLVVGAVSNWVWQLPELLHSLDLVSHFDFIAASSRIGFEKPHPEIFRWALEQADAEPSEAIHVGDHLDADVAGARGVGIQPVLIDRRDRFAPADVPDDTPLIRNLSELIPIVDARLPASVAGR